MGLRKGHPHVAIFLTDSNSSMIGETISQAILLHEAHIFQVYALGIGDANIMELAKISSSQTSIFFTSDFNEGAIQRLEQEVTQLICKCM